MAGAEEYFGKALAIAHQAAETQLGAIRVAAGLVAEALAGGKRFWVFGTGHSHTLAEELYGRAGGLAMTMTRQYLAGELSVLLGHLQAAATTEAATRDAWSLRHSAETGPIPALGSVTVSALTLAEGLCWDSLNRGDTAAFTRQAAVCAELHEFGVCACLLKEA